MAGVEVSIGADSRKAARELKSFEKKTKGIAASIAKGFKERVGHKLFDGLREAADQIPELINKSVNTASDLNEEISKGQVIFAGSAKEIRAFSKTSVESLGLSEVAAMQAAGQFGNLFKTMGMGEKEVSAMSQEMTGLAADLGSFHNTTTEDAIVAIGAALRGESEPIRRYGVLLDDATLKAEAMAQGLYNGTGSLKPATRALAAYQVILKQTGDAQGDFARTSDGYAGQKKILQANIENLTMQIGQKFLPLFQDVVSMLNDVDLDQVSDGIDTLAVGFSELSKDIESAWSTLQDFVEMVDILNLKENVWGNIFPDRVEKKESGMKEVPDFLKESTEVTQADEFMAALAKIDKAEEEKARKKIEALEAARAEADIMKEHDEMLKAQIHAERERLELLAEQTKEREKAAQAQRDDVRKGIQEDIASTLSDFGITGASQGNMLQDLLGIGFDKDEASRLVGLESKRQGLIDSRGQLDSLSGRGSAIAVSSMQRVGGGGGVYGELDLQRRQTDLQSKMVSLLEDLKKEANAMPLSEF